MGVVFVGAEKPVKLQYPAVTTGTDEEKTAKNADDSEIWKKSDADMVNCMTTYTLKADQSVFFGKGSSFNMVSDATTNKLTGKVQIESVEKINQVIATVPYEYDRAMTNIVPITIELVNKITVSADFHTQYKSRSYVELAYNYASQIGNPGKVDEFKAACDEKYKDDGIKCDVKKKEGATDTNTIVTLTGAKTTNAQGNEVAAAKQTIINKKIKEIEDAGKLTISTTFADMPVVQPAQELTEFIFFKEAREADNGELTIKMQVHSRSCIDHTTQGGNKGIKVHSQDATDHITGASTFTWTLVGGTGADKDEVKKTISSKSNLCEEDVEWKFKPKIDGTEYTIKLELDLLNGLGQFTVSAMVNIKQANILHNIEIRTAAKTYADEKCQTEDNFFALGEKVVVKVTLTPIVDCETITIDRVNIKQDSDTTSKNHVLKGKFGNDEADAKYLYKQLKATKLDTDGADVKAVAGLTLVKNEVAFEGELESTDFKIDVDGVSTTAVVDLTCKFKTGTTADGIMNVRRSLRWRTEVQVGSAKTTELSQETHAEGSFHIVAPEQTLAQAFVEAVIPSGHFTRFALGLGLLLGGFLSFNAYRSDKQEEYNPLMEI